MATNAPYIDVAYGLSQPLLNVFPFPIVSTRNPTSADRAQLGTVWVNKSTNDYFVLTSVAANVSTWSSVSNGAGIFTSLEATTGNITADLGDIVATAGNVQAGVNVTAGAIVAAGTAITAGTTITAAGNIRSTGGDIIANAGNITAVVGDVSAGGDVIAISDITSSSGNIIAAAGNITATLGDITAATGDIEASAGAIRGDQVESTGDLGGVALTTSFTNATNTALSSGTLSIKSTSANPGDNAGFIKIYVGATTAYLPYFTNIAP